MMRCCRFGVCASFALLATLGVLLSRTSGLAGSVPSPDAAPVEADAHEFMEYLNGPVFARLKAALAEPPKDRRAWVPIKSDALILAESGNLLLMRAPDKALADEWNQFAVELRTIGAELYKAGKQRNYEEARKHYVALARSCNNCHQDFSAGEPVVVP